MDEKPGVTWIIKSPFVAHSLHFQRSVVSTAKEAVAHVKNVWKDLFGHETLRSCYVVPYLILQERVLNNAESKLCFLNGKFHHFCTSSSVNLKQSFKDKLSKELISSTQIVEFATDVMTIFKNLEGNILDGLGRIDVFYDDTNQRMVVNEVES